MENFLDDQLVQSEDKVTRPKKTLSRGFARVTPLICTFCGGKGCKHENWLANPNSAIKGLNSDWVTDNILATQRPSSRLIKEFNIIEQFKAKDIGAILNLQEPGEHPYCGDGINPQSGFSYCPEEFYEHGIYFFNFGWRDMTATSPDLILKIMKQMSFILAEGQKIAVHCHAGRGRTGMIIAAWLIYNEHMSAKEAIKLVKTRRKESISKKSQENVLYELEREIKSLRTIFYSSPKLGLEQFLFNQKKVMPLLSTSEEKYVPKIISICLERMESLLISNVCEAKHIMAAFYSVNDKDCFQEKWDGKHEKILKSLKDRINQGRYESSDIEDPRYPAQLVLDFIDSFTTTAIGQRFIDIIETKLKGYTELTDSKREELFKEVNRKEFFLVESLARFFSVVIEADHNSASNLQQVISRLGISLLAGRHKYDKLFLKRSLIKLPTDEGKLGKLINFICMWIDGLSQDLSESIISPGMRYVQKSVKIERSELFKASRSRTFLAKTILKLQNEPDEEKGFDGTPKSSMNYRMNAHFDDMTESRHDMNDFLKMTTNHVSSVSKNGDISEISPIKENNEESFDEKDVFPSTGQGVRIKNPGQVKTASKKKSFFSKNHEVNLDILAPIKQDEKKIALTISSPKLVELFMSVEGLDIREQDLLLEKLLKIREKRQKPEL